MTREELEAWTASLNPSDIVIHKQWNNQLFKLIVTKVTPTGIVRTNSGLSFKLSSYSNVVKERGGYSEIIPATVELLEEVERQTFDRESIIERERKVRAAVHMMSFANVWNIPYEFAVEFLALCDKHGVRL